MPFNRPESKDDFTINPASAKLPTNALHGLFLVDLDEFSFRNRTIIEASDDTENNVVYLRVGPSSIYVGGVNAGTEIARAENTTHSRKGFVWLGVSIASDGNVQLSVNGELVSTATNGTSCPNFTKIRIGHSVFNKYEANAVFSNFGLFKSRTEFTNQYPLRTVPFIEGASADFNFLNNIDEAEVTLYNCPYWVNNKPYKSFSDIPGLVASGGLNGTVIRNGVLTSASAPRIGDDGLVVEGAATNKCQAYAAPTDLTGLTKTGDSAATLTVVDDSAELSAAGLAGITGSKAYKLDNSAGSSAAFVDISGATGNTNAHFPSAYWRGSGVGEVRLQGAGSGVVAVPLNYQRAGSAQTPSSSGDVWRLRAGVGAVIYFVCPQLEEGSTTSSYIPTSGSAVTRTADSVTLTDLDALGLTSSVLASGYTIYVKATVQWSGVVPLFEVNDATVNERVRLYFEAGALRLTVHRSGVQRTARAANVALSAGDVLTGAIRVAPDNVNVAANGQSATADTSALMPSPTRLQLFTDLANRFLNGAGVRLAVFPRALSDAELQALTA